MKELTVLVSNFFEQHLPTLQEQNPNVRFVVLPAMGDVPPEGRAAEVLLRAGMPKDALRCALKQAPGIKWIHTASAGFNWLLIPEVIEGPYIVTRSAAASNVPIAEFVIGFMLLVAKRFPALLKAQQERVWDRPDPEELTGKTVGIVGTGAIGNEVAQRASCLGLRVLGLKRTPEPLPYYERILAPSELHDLLRESDYVVLACPLTPETEGMIGRQELQIMKPSSVLINIARGPLVVEQDLIDALTSGLIAGACMDVFDQEPLPTDSPLWTLPNLVITPHCSYRSPHTTARTVREFTDNLHRFQAGEPLKNQLKDRTLGY